MMYRFLNTFIDDLFAFIIRMPTMHRAAVFRCVSSDNLVNIYVSVVTHMLALVLSRYQPPSNDIQFNVSTYIFNMVVLDIPTCLSCCSDDLVFFVYLYQRWVYPVDTSRLESPSGEALESSDAAAAGDDDNSQQETKKEK
jgi:hypothetical protein